MPAQGTAADARRFTPMENVAVRDGLRGSRLYLMLFGDLRYAVRTLRKSPVFTTASVLTMALTIGANTAIFSVVNAVLIRPLPVAGPDRVMQVAERNDRLNISQFAASILNYLSWKEQNRSFQDLGAMGGGGYILTGRGDPEQVNGATLTPSLMPLLGIQPVLGRGFRDGDDRPGAEPVALISEAFWRRHFAGERFAIGARLALNGVPIPWWASPRRDFRF